MRKKRTHAQIGINATYLRGIDLTIAKKSDCAEVNALAFQWLRNRTTSCMPFLTTLRTYRTQVAGNLVCQHFLQPETEQVWRIATIRSRYHITSRTCCST